ncbi:MAG: ExeM/NucH family extracellular endonuclease [Propionibacteriaceae bacterium]
MRLRRLSAYAVGFTLLVAGLVAAPEQAHAADPIPIADIQGTGVSTPKAGQVVTTTPSRVTAVYGQGAAAEFRGFVIQTPGTGGAARDLTRASDAVFVFLGSATAAVAIGDVVSVTGTAGEFSGLTQIGGAVTVTKVTGSFPTIRPLSGLRWADTVAQRENLESMLYASTERFTVSDTFPLLRFGELGLTSAELPLQPTEVARPGSAEASAQAARNLAIRVNLDDGSNRGFTRTATLAARPLPYLSVGVEVAIGDRLRLTEPVIVDFRNGVWKFNPTTPTEPGAEPAVIRQVADDPAPRVGGALSVASFNVLNYFTTTGQGRASCNGGNLDTEHSFNVTFDCDARGAWDDADFGRQQSKIVAAVNALDADVVGLMEIENSAALGEQPDEALGALVTALNRAAGFRKWAFVPSSTELQATSEQDVITNALIYQPRWVHLASPAYALGAAAGPDGPFANARTPIAASFAAWAGGDPVLVVVNHLKSKGADGATGDNADIGDGQGAYNGDRVRQAGALRDWVPSVQQRARASAVALIGDFNSYGQEDPLQVLYTAGYRNAAPDDEWSYSFSGLAGSLDHVLLNGPARSRLNRADIWNVNSGESPALEYSTYKTTTTDLYAPDARRSSDHDPVVVGFRRR